MMSRYIWSILFLLLSTASIAQQGDSTFAVKKGPSLAIRYYLKSKETLAMLANRYYISQEVLETTSGVDGRKKLPAGTMLHIPLNKDNFKCAEEASGLLHWEKVFYRVGEKDDLALISLYAGAKKQDIIQWNTLKGSRLSEGQVLFIGWVKVVEKTEENIENGLAYPTQKNVASNAASVDTVRHAYGELDSAYFAQTKNGKNIISEKGSAAFFEKAGKNNIYYAFHNTTQRGAIIKVINPGTGKYIYAKVLSSLPDTKQFANCIIGLSATAKDALGITESKAWVELTYSPE